MISRALHPDVFDQPGRKLLFQQPANVMLPAHPETLLPEPETLTRTSRNQN
jgi:hypothetical protein